MPTEHIISEPGRTTQKKSITILDGGMGRELKKRGAPFGQPEWSAATLIQRPDLVKQAHESYIQAGSDILTTSNYAVVPFHIGKDRFESDGARLTALAGRLAQEAASESGCMVAGSIPPVFGSYRPDLYDSDNAPSLLKLIIEALHPYVDLWLVETVSSIVEAKTAARLLTEDTRPVWVSFTLMDTPDNETTTPRLRSGESVNDAVREMAQSGVTAILFNCSQAEVMSAAVATAVEQLQRIGVAIPLGVYANAFPSLPEKTAANSTLQKIRDDLDPDSYLALAKEWCRLGATIVGGCCGIGPEHIAQLKRALGDGL